MPRKLYSNPFDEGVFGGVKVESPKEKEKKKEKKKDQKKKPNSSAFKKAMNRQRNK